MKTATKRPTPKWLFVYRQRKGQKDLTITAKDEPTARLRAAKKALRLGYGKRLVTVVKIRRIIVP